MKFLFYNELMTKANDLVEARGVPEYKDTAFLPELILLTNWPL